VRPSQHSVHRSTQRVAARGAHTTSDWCSMDHWTSKRGRPPRCAFFTARQSRARGAALSPGCRTPGRARARAPAAPPAPPVAAQRAAPVIPGCHRLSLTSPAVILHSALPFCPAILQLTAIDCHPLVLGICILHTNLAVVAVHFSQNDGVAPGQPALLVYGGSQSRCGCARPAQSLSVAGRERSLEGILQGGAEGV
jgi:hypothetical protein